ncbi:hypothetical protein IFM89_025634 [Coptis chinensis]|uniref:Calmodulin-binding domain-containing protein n=1 Tax=Coptis chinensis TaxID=261450 RepID=A0A835H6N5_9MAGN|nr:hypothetical protein IFM89_025634 [Coptis chinensis]
MAENGFWFYLTKLGGLKSENSAPRRLRFRKGRVLGENENAKGDNKRKNFKKREVDNGGTTGDAESEKVLLRHQDVNGKKDTQGLLNNVIEETQVRLRPEEQSQVLDSSVEVWKHCIQELKYTLVSKSSSLRHSDCN